MPKTGKNKLKNSVINIGLVLGSLLLALLLLEAGLRMFYPQSQYAVVCAPWGFTHKSRCDIVYYDEQPSWRIKPHPVPIHYNSRGLRDYEYAYSKPAGVFRILILGDSWAEDMGSFLENLHVKRLEKRLNSFGLPIKFEVINAGHYAFDNAQELMFYLREGKKYHPDLVMVMYAADTASPEYALAEGGKLQLFYKDFTLWQKIYREIVASVRANSHLGNFLLNRLSRIRSLDHLLREWGWKEREAAWAKFPQDHPSLDLIAEADSAIAEQVTITSQNVAGFSEADKLIWKRFREELKKDQGEFVLINNFPAAFPAENERFLEKEGILFFSIQWQPQEARRLKENDIQKGSYDKFLDSHRFGYKQHPLVSEQILVFLAQNRLIPYGEEIIRKQQQKTGSGL